MLGKRSRWRDSSAIASQVCNLHSSLHTSQLITDMLHTGTKSPTASFQFCGHKVLLSAKSLLGICLTDRFFHAAMEEHGFRCLAACCTHALSTKKASENVLAGMSTACSACQILQWSGGQFDDRDIRQGCRGFACRKGWSVRAFKYCSLSHLMLFGRQGNDFAGLQRLRSGVYNFRSSLCIAEGVD